MTNENFTDVGFNARSSFYNAFNRVTGQTPTNYRKMVSLRDGMDDAMGQIQESRSSSRLRATFENIWKETSMKKYLFLAVLGLSGCETAAEIAARDQIDTACIAGNLKACALVEKRVAARNRDDAISATAPIAGLLSK